MIKFIVCRTISAVYVSKVIFESLRVVGRRVRLIHSAFDDGLQFDLCFSSPFESLGAYVGRVCRPVDVKQNS